MHVQSTEAVETTLRRISPQNSPVQTFFCIYPCNPCRTGWMWICAYCIYLVITRMSLAIWFTGPLSWPARSWKKIGQRRFRTCLILVFHTRLQASQCKDWYKLKFLSVPREPWQRRYWLPSTHAIGRMGTGQKQKPSHKFNSNAWSTTLCRSRRWVWASANTYLICSLSNKIAESAQWSLYKNMTECAVDVKLERFPETCRDEKHGPFSLFPNFFWQHCAERIVCPSQMPNRWNHWLMDATFPKKRWCVSGCCHVWVYLVPFSCTAI